MISRFAWGTCIRWIDFISRYNWTICITAVFLHILYIDNNKSYLLNLPCVYHIHCTRNVNQSSWTAQTLNDPVIFLSQIINKSHSLILKIPTMLTAFSHLKVLRFLEVLYFFSLPSCPAFQLLLLLFFG